MLIVVAFFCAPAAETPGEVAKVDRLEQNPEEQEASEEELLLREAQELRNTLTQWQTRGDKLRVSTLRQADMVSHIGLPWGGDTCQLAMSTGAVGSQVAANMAKVVWHHHETLCTRSHFDATPLGCKLAPEADCCSCQGVPTKPPCHAN